jgi:DNA-binding NtrC family response regulator
VLQERQIERLGSNRPIDVDVRIISASQRPLEEEIEAGRFREDLLFRVNTVTINLVPLRERIEDVPLLANAFLHELAGQSGAAIEGYSDEVLEIFAAHPWPGNVRELRNVVERAVLFCRSPLVTVEELPPALRSYRGKRRQPPSGEVKTLREAVARAEIEAIRAALLATGNRRVEAARLLGISRKTLWEKIKHYRVRVDRPAQS